MSFEIHVQSYRSGDLVGISRQLVIDAIGQHLNQIERNRWLLEYNAANTCEIDLDADDQDCGHVLGFTVQRPCGDQSHWDSLAAILHLGNIVLYFPGCRAPLVTHATATANLPTDLFSSLGPPEWVVSGRDIQQAILNA